MRISRREFALALLAALTVIAVTTFAIPDSARSDAAEPAARTGTDSLAPSDSTARRDSIARATAGTAHDPPCLASRLGLPCAE